MNMHFHSLDYVADQRADPGRSGGAEDGAARRRHLHAQRFSKSKPSAKSMGN